MRDKSGKDNARQVRNMDQERERKRKKKEKGNRKKFPLLTHLSKGRNGILRYNVAIKSVKKVA